MNFEFSSTGSPLALTASYRHGPEMVVISSAAQQSISLRANPHEEDDWTDIDRVEPTDSQLEQLVHFYRSHPETA
jgi:hypothetical protein